MSEITKTKARRDPARPARFCKLTQLVISFNNGRNSFAGRSEKRNTHALCSCKVLETKRFSLSQTNFCWLQHLVAFGHYVQSLERDVTSGFCSVYCKSFVNQTANIHSAARYRASLRYWVGWCAMFGQICRGYSAFARSSSAFVMKLGSDFLFRQDTSAGTAQTK